jgi:hypothetical protein
VCNVGSQRLHHLSSRFLPFFVLTFYDISPACHSRFEWNGPKGVSTTWDTMFETLLEYKKEHGDTMVPTHKFVPKHLTKISNWVSRRSRMIVLIMPGRMVHLYLQNYLVFYVLAIHQVHYQRKKYAAKQKALRGEATSKDHKELTDEEERRLTEIGFQFISDKKTWEEQYQVLKEFAEEHGHARVPTICVENRALGSFVHTMRRYWKLQVKDPNAKKAQSLTAERIRLLDEIGFVWDAKGSGGGEMPDSDKKQRIGSGAAGSHNSKRNDSGQQSSTSNNDEEREGESGSGTDSEDEARGPFYAAGVNGHPHIHNAAAHLHQPGDVDDGYNWGPGAQPAVRYPSYTQH